MNPDLPQRPTVGDRLEQAIERKVELPVQAAAEAATEASAEVAGKQRRSLVWNVVWLAITAGSLYLVFPSLVETFGSWRQMENFSLWAVAAMFVLQVGVCATQWDLQRVALGDAHGEIAWRPVIAAQLSSNALANIAPGGGPLGAALQYRILAAAGYSGGWVVSAVTAVNLLLLSIVFALPLLAIPALFQGPVDRGLLDAAIIAVFAFVVMAALAAVFLKTDGPLEWTGRTVASVRNRLRPNRPPITDLPQRLVAERDQIASVLGQHWRRALVMAVGKWILDYLTLHVALSAIGSHPRPGLVLMAFCVAKALGNIPLTPGGLGFVEAGMTAMLALAGVNPADALLATFAYRLFSFWLPIPFGLLGMAIAPKQ